MKEFGNLYDGAGYIIYPKAADFDKPRNTSFVEGRLRLQESNA